MSTLKQGRSQSPVRQQTMDPSMTFPPSRRGESLLDARGGKLLEGGSSHLIESPFASQSQIDVAESLAPPPHLVEGVPPLYASSEAAAPASAVDNVRLG